MRPSSRLSLLLLLLLCFTLFCSCALAQDADAAVNQGAPNDDEKPVPNEPLKPDTDDDDDGGDADADADADANDEEEEKIKKQIAEIEKELEGKPPLDPKLDAAAVDDNLDDEDLPGGKALEAAMKDAAAGRLADAGKVSEAEEKEKQEIDQLLAEVKKLEEENRLDNVRNNHQPVDRDSLMQDPNRVGADAATADDKSLSNDSSSSSLGLRRTGLDAPLGLAAGQDAQSMKRQDDQAAMMPNRPLSEEALQKQPMAALAKVDPNAELLKYDPDAAEAMRFNGAGALDGRQAEFGNSATMRESDWAAANRIAYEREKEEMAILRFRDQRMAKELDLLTKQVGSLKDTLASAQRDKTIAEQRVEKERFLHRQALESVRDEVKAEREELMESVDERKRAFDELLEEKKMLTSELESEAKTLEELQEKIQHPDLGVWIKQRAKRATILMEAPETDAMKHYASRYMAPGVKKMKHRLEELERKVEDSVDHVVPGKYGGVVAVFLCVFLVGFPLMVTMSSVFALTRSVSLRQYVLLGNVFLAAFSLGLLIAGLVLFEDPLQTLYEASEKVFILLQVAASIAFPCFLLVLGLAAARGRDRKEQWVFGCELMFYVLVGLDYRKRVWRPAMLGENIDTSWMMYMVHFVDFVCMTALTVSSARGGEQLPTLFSDDGSKRIPSVLKEAGANGSAGIIGALSATSGKKE